MSIPITIKSIQRGNFDESNVMLIGIEKVPLFFKEDYEEINYFCFQFYLGLLTRQEMCSFILLHFGWTRVH